MNQAKLRWRELTARFMPRRNEEPSAAAGDEHDDPRRRLVVPVVVVVVVLALFLATGVDILAVLVGGISLGSLYGFVALGLALVYRSTGVLNFAQGEFGTVPVFVVVYLLAGGVPETFDTASVGLGELLAFSLLAVLLGALLGVATNLLIVQRLAESSAVTTLVATAGLALLFISGEFLIFGANPRPFPQFVEGWPCLESAGGDCIRFLSTPGGGQISWHTLLILVVLAVVALALAALFRTPVGVALLAAAQEPFAAQLHGISVRAMSTLAWGAAGALGAVAGILTAMDGQLVFPGLLTANVLLPAFTALLLGGITSMVGAVVGGLLLGVVVVFANSAILSLGLSGTVPDAPTTATFVLLLLVLFLRPSGLLGGEA